MKTIRIMSLYMYYLGTLKNAVDTCYSIKANYTSGITSYKRAYKEMNEALRFAWQRYNLCFRLTEMVGENPAFMKIQELNQDLKFLTAWTIE